MWAAHRRHHHLLGRQPLRDDGRAGRAVLRRHRRLLPFVRAAYRRHHHLLGPPCQPLKVVAMTVADFFAAPTTSRRTRRPGSSPPSLRAWRMRAGCAPTAPSPAGAATPTGRRTRRPGSSPAVTAGRSIHTPACGLRTGRHHHLLGRQHRRVGRQLLRGGDRAGRAVLRRRRRPRPCVRAAHRRHHHLLGDSTPTRWATTTTGRRTRRPGSSPPSPPAFSIRAGCASTAPSPAGDSTSTGWRTRRPGSSPPSSPATAMRAGCAPTAPSPAGATTASGQATAPDG